MCRFALDITHAFLTTRGSKRTYDVSFVGSSFGTDLGYLLLALRPLVEVREIVLDAMFYHKENPHTDIREYLLKRGVDFAVPLCEEGSKRGLF